MKRSEDIPGSGPRPGPNDSPKPGGESAPARSPDDLVAALEDADLEHECARIAALSESELDRELESAGLVPATFRAGAAPIVEAAIRRRNAASPTKRRTDAAWSAGRVMRSARFAPIAVAGSVAVVVGAAAVMQGARPGSVLRVFPAFTDSADATPSAERLRTEAEAACKVGQWAECASRLDAARALDPKGELAPRVEALRHAIAEARSAARPGP